ncbi:hypothetical protein COA05_14470 [Bacillus thuringiensis]|nr:MULTISPECIES: hypothetical protein [Bacillus cereus group]MEB8877630.1 hypothetical protein [Bacillus cereus]AKR36843.1 Hypothetical protein NF53_3765 [Bacillus thuringiensis serovar indiana]KAA0773527.1 hypothetical protein DN404_15605 [Bacillus sp. TE8-1]MBG9646192.1 hypothetical protein [Bacillus thuringiensis]MBG9652883.1 hypothetical protein [Bacillus thuringiensis]
MYSIGIRVFAQKDKPGKIYYAVIKKHEDGELELINSSYLNIPIALAVPEQLAFIRTNFLALITQYNIKKAGLRVTETIARKPLVYRMNIEGVLQELFANSSIEEYGLINIAKMSKALSISMPEIKLYIDKKEIFDGFERKQWESFKTEERECILTALTVLFQKEEEN